MADKTQVGCKSSIYHIYVVTIFNCKKLRPSKTTFCPYPCNNSPNFYKLPKNFFERLEPIIG